MGVSVERLEKMPAGHVRRLLVANEARADYVQYRIENPLPK